MSSKAFKSIDTIIFWCQIFYNRLFLNNCNYCTIERVFLDRSKGYGIGGFNWFTDIRHCQAYKCDVGFGPITTTGIIANCYANECRIGYEIFCSYGSIIGCGSDWADIAYSFSEPWSVAIIGCGCEQALQAMNGRCLNLSVQGFTVDQTDVIGEFIFSSGGPYEIKRGDVITGETSGATATVYRIHLESGSWAAGTAAGTIRINTAPVGTFCAETISVGTTPNVATIAGNIAKRESCFYLPQTKGIFGGIYGKVTSSFWFDGTGNSPDLTIFMPDSFTGNFKEKIKDYSAATYCAVPRVIGNPYTGYNQYVKNPSELRALLESDFTLFSACHELEILLNDGSVTYSSTVTMRNTEGIGPLIIRNNVSALGPILTFNPSSGTGMVLQDIKIPIVFRNIYFKLNQTVHMIDIKRCTLIRFEGCKFETLVSGGRVLNIDEYSSVEIDKATMDNMATSNWWGLDNSGRTDAIKFIGYSAKPTVGLFSAGYRVIFVSPASGTYSGAICTDGGAPGVWKGFGLIE